MYVGSIETERKREKRGRKRARWCRKNELRVKKLGGKWRSGGLGGGWEREVETKRTECSDKSAVIVPEESTSLGTRLWSFLRLSCNFAKIMLSENTSGYTRKLAKIVPPDEGFTTDITKPSEENKRKKVQFARSILSNVSLRERERSRTFKYYYKRIGLVLCYPVSLCYFV